MSHRAKILPFRSRPATVALSQREAQRAAHEFLAVPLEERNADHRQRFLCSPDVLLSIVSHLRESRDTAPGMVWREATDIYKWISQPDCDLGVFDERDYFLGETALLAGVACRHLGRREEAFRWLDRAEAGFRHTMNPGPGLANIAYARLALRFEMGRYEDVLELLPSLEASFEKLRMDLEAAKCRVLHANTLKMAGEHLGAIELLDSLKQKDSLGPDLQALVLAELGDLHQMQGNLQVAMSSFQAALSLLSERDLSPVKANLKLYVGGVYKAIGSLENAKEAFRAALRDYEELQMRPLVAYTHLVIAETLLEMKRDREAEWEILAALPAIDEMQMLPEAIAAVSLLRQSVERRKTDGIALQQVRDHLQTAG